MLPPRENLLTCAGVIAGVVVLAFALDSGAPAEADTHAAQQARQEQRREVAAARACPKGYAVRWLGEREMQCLKEELP